MIDFDQYEVLTEFEAGVKLKKMDFAIPRQRLVKYVPLSWEFHINKQEPICNFRTELDAEEALLDYLIKNKYLRPKQ